MRYFASLAVTGQHRLLVMVHLNPFPFFQLAIDGFVAAADDLLAFVDPIQNLDEVVVADAALYFEPVSATLANFEDDFLRFWALFAALLGGVVTGFVILVHIFLRPLLFFFELFGQPHGHAL